MNLIQNAMCARAIMTGRDEPIAQEPLTWVTHRICVLCFPEALEEASVPSGRLTRFAGSSSASPPPCLALKNACCHNLRGQAHMPSKHGLLDAILPCIGSQLALAYLNYWKSCRALAWPSTLQLLLTLCLVQAHTSKQPHFQKIYCLHNTHGCVCEFLVLVSDCAGAGMQSKFRTRVLLQALHEQGACPHG